MKLFKTIISLFQGKKLTKLERLTSNKLYIENQRYKIISEYNGYVLNLCSVENGEEYATNRAVEILEEQKEEYLRDLESKSW